MLQLCAAGRGITVPPDWLLDAEAGDLPIRRLRIGYKGLNKNIHLSTRQGDGGTAHVAGFLDIARAVSPPDGRTRRSTRSAITGSKDGAA